MLSSFEPGNSIYNCINLYRKKSLVKSKIINRKIFLPHLNLGIKNFNFKDFEINNNNKSVKNLPILKISKGCNTPRNIKLNKVNILSNFINSKEINKSDFDIRNIFKYKIKKINSKKLFESQSCKNIFNKNFSLFNTNNKTQNINQYILKRNSSLPELKNISFIDYSEINKCNYIYLEYKGKNYKNKKKKTYIQINPHKLIEQLKSISIPFDIYGMKFVSNSEIKVNKYNDNDNNNHREDYLKYIKNISRNKPEKGIKLYSNKINNPFSDKTNKYNYFVKNIFFSDIMNKVMKKIFEIRDKHNKIITHDDIKKEYDKQLYKLKSFFYYKQKKDNKKILRKKNEMKIFIKLMIIKDIIEKSDKENDIKIKNINYKNLFNSNNEDIFMKNSLDKKIYSYNIKGKNIEDINKINKNFNKFLLLSPIERKNGNNSKIDEYLFSDKLNKNILNENNNDLKIEKLNYSFEFGEKINLVNLEDIYNEIEFQSKENNYNKNKNLIINIILSEKDNFKKLKFDNKISKKFIDILREENINNNDIYKNKQITRNKKLNIIKEIKEIKEDKNKYPIIKENINIKKIKNDIIYENLSMKNLNKRNKSAERTHKNKFIIKDIIFNFDKIIRNHDIDLFSNISENFDNKSCQTESENLKFKKRKLYIKNLKLNKKEFSSSVSTTTNNNVENKNNLNDNENNDNSKIIFDFSHINNSVGSSDIIHSKPQNLKVNKNSNLELLPRIKSKNKNDKRENKNKIKNELLVKNKINSGAKKEINKSTQINKHHIKYYKKININNNIYNKSNNKIKTQKYQRKTKFIKSLENQKIKKHSNHLSIDLKESSIENESCFTSSSFSSLLIPNLIILSENNILSNKNSFSKYKTFYINKKYYKNKKFIKKFKSSPNINKIYYSKILLNNKINNNKIKSISVNQKNNKVNKVNNINKVNNLNKVQSINRRITKTIQTLKPVFRKKYKKKIFEQTFINNDILSEKKYFKTISYFICLYNKNIDTDTYTDESNASLSYWNIFKKVGTKQKKNKKNLDNKNLKRSNSFLNNEKEKKIYSLEEKIKKIKENNAEKNWERKFNKFKAHIKKFKNTSYKDFIENNDKDKEIESLLLNLELGTDSRINNFKKYIRYYRSKINNLNKENTNQIVFKHPCIFDKGKIFQ